MRSTIFKKKSDVKGGTHRQGAKTANETFRPMELKRMGCYELGFSRNFLISVVAARKAARMASSEAFRFFAGGNGVARRQIQKKQGFGVVGSLFMMWIFGECHSGMGNVVIFRLEIGYPGFNLLFPSGRHAHVPTFNFDIHHSPHRLR